MCLLFAKLASALNTECVGGNKSCCAAEPAGEDCLWTERFRFPCQDDENALGDFLSQMGVADLAQGVIPAAQARKVMDLCWGIEKLANAAELAKAAAA